MLNDKAQSFFDRVEAGARKSKDLTGIANWVVQNTTDPRDPTRSWSFENHEFQKGILNDSHNHVVCRKCSQVGLSEIVVRLQLALLAIYQSTTAIYTLPTTAFARQFTKSRIDPVIDQSPLLKDLVPSSNDSSELKQLGTSFLYVRGSFGQGAAISIPADILINDEVDFSNQQALTTFSSRLGHAKLGDGKGIRREFSTPTVEGYGVSKTFSLSSQQHYMVKCDGCHTWQALDFFDDVVIPGFDAPTIEFDKEDIGEHDISKAFLACPGCRHRFTVANLNDPDKRQWVAKRPDAAISGYQVYPFDVPTINPPSRTLEYLRDYERKADWVNFKVGLPYEDAETSFLVERIRQYSTASWTVPGQGAGSGCVMGVDVGKTSWVVIGKRVKHSTDILYMERVKQDGNDYLHTRLQQLIDWFGVICCVVDAAPDFSTALKLVERNYSGRVYGNYYVRSLPAQMTSMQADPDKGTIKSIRTLTFDELAQRVNTGSIQWPKHTEMDLMETHLGNMKRVSEMSNQGELVHRWVKTGDDHYAHALNYMGLADKLVDKGSTAHVTPTLPLAGTAKVSSEALGEEDGDSHHPLLRQRRLMNG